jgi:hypothetical protein
VLNTLGVFAMGRSDPIALRIELGLPGRIPVDQQVDVVLQTQHHEASRFDLLIASGAPPFAGASTARFSGCIAPFRSV